MLGASLTLTNKLQVHTFSALPPMHCMLLHKHLQRQSQSPMYAWQVSCSSQVTLLSILCA